jgi:hypothetical protein
MPTWVCFSLYFNSPVSMFISPTIVNIEKDATESEIVYTAVTNENKVTYTLKSGFQKEKFTIDTIPSN